MGPEKDYQIRDLGSIVLTLRSDLVFTPQSVDGRSGYLIEDPVKTKFYRIGIAEYRFISLFDGATSVADALRLTASTLGSAAFTQDEAGTICKWLVDTGLAYTRESTQAGRLSAAADAAGQARMVQQLNPMFIRVPLVRPDRVLAVVAPWLGWMHGPLGWTLATAVGLVACCHLLVHGDRFFRATDGILAPHRCVWLAATWLILKIVHEASHGLVCKRYGGTVREAGVLFVLLAPMAYVDVTSSWRFHSKWQRIHTSAAGMFGELVIAALAVIVWSHTGPGVVNDLAFNVVIMASLTTLLFNANPLMRFDGYYMLSDLLEVPNLYSNGQQYVRYLGRRYLLGATLTSPCWSQGKDRFIKLYAVAALTWRVIVTATLLIAATALFAGAGIILAIVAAGLWLGLPLLRFVKYFLTDPTISRSNQLRFVGTSTAILALGVLFFTVVPWPGVVWAPAIVEYSTMAVVRAGSAGFVRQVMVKNGQFVTEGDVLLVLANDELRAELADLDLQIKDVRLLGRAHMQNGRMAAYQAEMKRYESLDKQRQQKRVQVEQLTVVAPIGGQIIGRNLPSIRGTYVNEGAELFSIGNKRAKEIQISVAQEDLETFSHRLGKPVSVRVRGAGRLISSCQTVSPRASLKPLHAGLIAPNGGPLAVHRRTDEMAPTEQETESYELLAPRFLAVVSLDERDSSRLHAGQRGVASFWDSSDTIGKHIYESVSHWVRKKFEQASAAS